MLLFEGIFLSEYREKSVADKENKRNKGTMSLHPTRVIMGNPFLQSFDIVF